MLKTVLCGCLCLGGLQAGELPAWWQGFPALAQLESPFVQESESAVFGKLRREGVLRLAQGGRLRVEYRQGMLLVADGRSLVQYDPQARTAQRLDLRQAARDTPLLNLLLNPKTLAEFYQARNGDAGSVVLEPRKPGLPRVTLGGKGRFLNHLQWTDATGAKQILELSAPHLPAAPFAKAVFTFQAPAGTRWLDGR